MSNHAELTAELKRIDEQMTALTIARSRVVNKLQYICLANAMREVGKFSLERLEKEMTEGLDPVQARVFVNNSLIAWRHSLGYTFFPNAMEAIPEYGASRLSKQDAISLFTAVAEALKKDLAALEPEKLE